MILLYYEMEVLIRSVAFYLVSNARMEHLEEAGLELCMNLPGIAFYGIYKFVFYCILPYGIMATLPVQSLIGGDELGDGGFRNRGGVRFQRADGPGMEKRDKTLQQRQFVRKGWK